MKKIFLLLLIILIAGCKHKDMLLGTWTTSYNINSIGEIIETYEFKENNKCVRIVDSGSKIINDCTYELKENEIRILWEDKIDKESYISFEQVNKNTIVIGSQTFKRE